MGYNIPRGNHMSTQKTRRVRKPHKRRRRNRLHTVMILALVIAVVLVLALLLQSALFDVKTIVVRGNTRYNEADIVKVSKIYVGQNIWTVDKKGAVDSILAAFSYFETAKIWNASYNQLVIEVTEAEELGVIHTDGKWVVVGTHNKILQTLEVESAYPPRLRYFKGAEAYPHNDGVDIGVGKFAMEENCFKLVQEIQEMLVYYELDDIGVVDITERGSLRLDYGGRILIKLGGEANVAHKIGMAASSLPYIAENYGAEISGTLDVSFQAEGKSGEMGVFTPSE